MGKGNNKPVKIRFHEGLAQIRTDAGGIDVGSREIWVDVGIGRDPEPVRSFETFTADLVEMAEWLKRCGIRSVAMESTGVYWIPVCQILEPRGIEVVLVNAAYAKNVSGRKSDTLDCQWLRTLHSYGLLPASFRPAADIGVLRSYLRHRQMLIEYAAGHIQHMQKALTQMNLQLAHVISDITGMTGMRIIRAIVAGERDPARLAMLRVGHGKSDEQTIAKALKGDYRSEHLFALRQNLELFDSYEKQIQDCDQQIAAHLQTLESKVDPVQEPLKARRTPKKKRRNVPQFDCRSQAYRISGVDLTRIDSISESAALGLIAEIGVDMTPWKTEKHFVSWLTLCPNNKVSGGKVLQRRTRKSASRARGILCLCAQSLLGSRSALGAYCRRLSARLGTPKGITAAAHKLALLVYRMIKFGRDYVDVGQNRYEELFKQRTLKQLARRARDLGFNLVPSSEGLVP
jgi:transposase